MESILGVERTALRLQQENDFLQPLSTAKSPSPFHELGELVAGHGKATDIPLVVSTLGLFSPGQGETPERDLFYDAVESLASI